MDTHAERTPRRMRTRVARVTTLLGLLVFLNLQACAQSPVLKSGLETEGHAVRAVFTSVVANAHRATVQLRAVDGDTPLALGLVVSEAGAVLTKASELRDDNGWPLAIDATLPDGRRVSVVRVATDPRSDLALLRIDPPATGLVALDPAAHAGAVPTPGSWIAVPGIDAVPDAVGIVSAAPRGLAPVRLGVLFRQLRGRGDSPGQLVVRGVQDNMGAAQAGVRPGDRLLRLNDHDLVQVRDLVEPLRDVSVGDTVKLTVERDGKPLILEVTLMNRPLNLKDREDFMNQMGNSLSRRRDGFDAVLQHDATIEPEQCGGPLVDLNGQLVGLNIARAGRVESYALPVDQVVAALARLRASAAQTHP